ncbi:CocE/NonD family hydrolase [Sphingomonas bacterium]|uniref:CocE/NonD family hydrolase n=1 Tax=Sphingomonas bacterium TaxID=1895847 RepID=UPI0015761FA9|nr:CocE/NonD family hydrolase [Sphingomonas bacterium]
MSFALKLKLAGCMALGIGLVGSQAARAQAAAPDAPTWSGVPRPATSKVVKRSTYVAMPDGTRLAVDIYLPDVVAPGQKLPTVLEQTRYYRSTVVGADAAQSCKAVSPHFAFFASRGYAVVVLDVRGTGASFGTRAAEFSDVEVEDGSRIVDWIAAQPWSNGSVGDEGISYVGTTAEMLLRNHNRHVKAVAPISAGYDYYTDLDFPGGVRNQFFITGWGGFDRALDVGHPELVPILKQLDWRGPCPVDGDEDGKLKAAAIAGHQRNINSGAELGPVNFRDDPSLSGPTTWPNPAIYRTSIDQLHTPLLAISGWYDSGYANGAIERFQNSASPERRLIIPSSNHGVKAFYEPGVAQPTASSFDADAEILRFFDHYVAGIDNGYEREPRVRWFTTGVDQWRSAATWPRQAKGATFCLTKVATLDAGSCAGSGSIDYSPTGDAGTGDNSRWNTTLGGGPVFYADRGAADRQLLSFTGPALTAAAEVTGYPTLDLAVTNPAADADYFVYLEEVKPSGASLYVTEGELRSSHSAIGAVDHKSFAPSHSDLAKDKLADTANRRLQIAIRLQPISHVFTKGSRIRLVIAGADKAHFASPASAGQHWTIDIGQGGSQLHLPLAPVSGS